MHAMCAHLLEQDGPQLVAVASHVDWLLRALLAGDQIVHDHRHPRLLLGVEETNAVAAARIELPVDEGLADRTRVFRRARQRRNKPAVADGALTQVGRFDGALVQLRAARLAILLLALSGGRPDVGCARAWESSQQD